MKSTVINFSSDNDNLNAILEESQKLSAYVNLDRRQSLRLRLLSEELVGMLKELSGNYEGQFWAEVEERKVELVSSIFVIDEMDNKPKKGFINVSSKKKNAAAKGIMGKIRDVVENMMYPENAALASNYMASQLGVDAAFGDARSSEGTYDSTCAESIVDNEMLGDGWSLNRYKSKQRDNKEPWDEIEKSIIANIADDVTVSVKGKAVEIRISKRFE